MDQLIYPQITQFCPRITRIFTNFFVLVRENSCNSWTKKNKMKKVIITSVIVLFSITAMAQDRKVAVFDPAGSAVDNTIKEIVREEISSIIVNSGSYIVLERQLIDKVLEENRFQSGGLVDDSQISEIGKQMGANVVFVSSIASMGSNLYISCKIIDVQTARIEKQRTALTQRGQTDLIAVVQRVVNDMFADVPKPAVKTPKPAETPQQPAKPAETPKQPAKPVVVEEKLPPIDPAKMLVADGRKVYKGGSILNKWEVRYEMANTDALRLYDKGIKRNRNGNIWLFTGLAMMAGGAYVTLAQPLDTQYSYTGEKFWYYDNNHYERYYDNNLYFGYNNGFNYIVGGSIAGTGVVMAITGMIIKAASKKPVKQSVEMYNNGLRNKTTMEMKFGFTGNSVHLALLF